MKDNIMELGIQMFTLDARYMYRYNITWIDGKRDFSWSSAKISRKLNRESEADEDVGEKENEDTISDVKNIGITNVSHSLEI